MDMTVRDRFKIGGGMADEGEDRAQETDMHVCRPTPPASVRRRARVTILALAALALVAAACQPDSSGIASARGSNGAVIDIKGAQSAGGTMGVDIMLGPDEYNPCHLQTDTQDASVVYNDRWYGACIDSASGRNSYYTHVGYSSGGPELMGVNIGNADLNFCRQQPWCSAKDPVLVHFWANRATAWALEFYPSAANEGGVRITGRFDFTTLDNRGFSGPIDAMRPVTDATPGSFHLVGNLAGGPWADRRFEVAAFQMPPWTMTTTGGTVEEGFADIGNTGTSLRSWAMIRGTYKIYVTDHATGASTIVYRDLAPGARLDLVPALPCFGLVGGLDPNTEQRVC
jgi:hypothetical protein